MAGLAIAWQRRHMQNHSKKVKKNSYFDNNVTTLPHLVSANALLASFMQLNKAQRVTELQFYTAICTNHHYWIPAQRSGAKSQIRY
jgi:hypothetical protein